MTLVSALRPRALTVDDQRQVDRIHLQHTAGVFDSAGNDALALDDGVTFHLVPIGEEGEVVGLDGGVRLTTVGAVRREGERGPGDRFD